MEKNIFKNAFTLAEVLIVLGILGVVAAMTIPTLVNKVQNLEYVAGLKKFYTTQDNGWKQMLADEGVENLNDTSAFQSLPNYPDICYVRDINAAKCSVFFTSMKKYFKFTPVTSPSYQLYYLKGSKENNHYMVPTLAFADGSVLFDGSFDKNETASKENISTITNGGGHLYGLSAALYIDVNGFKSPNTYGRDIFKFFLSDDGRLYPEWGKDISLYTVGDLSEYWKNVPGLCGTSGSTNISSAIGYGCATRIMEEGWEMNY